MIEFIIFSVFSWEEPFSETIDTITIDHDEKNSTSTTVRQPCTVIFCYLNLLHICLFPDLVQGKRFINKRTQVPYKI